VSGWVARVNPLPNLGFEIVKVAIKGRRLQIFDERV
tara:strand:- start:66819 stop:66926 length:108 start_codon:yes stop_codon:yes gene_type:complete